MKNIRRWAPWIVATLLVAVAVELGAGSRNERRGGPLLMAPIASVFASVQWVLVDEAFRSGETLRAFELSERALALDPGASEGYALLVHEQMHTLGSLLREPDAERRRAWLVSALATAERGVERARDPGLVALVAGIGLHIHATSEAPPPWTGRAGALTDESRVWLERARDLGRSEAESFLEALDRSQ